jgi:hypothetical protein
MFVKAEANADRDGVGDLSREDGQRVAGTKSFEGEEPLEHVLSALRSFRGAAAAQLPHALDWRARRARTSRACGRARVLGCAGRPGPSPGSVQPIGRIPSVR